MRNPASDFTAVTDLLHVYFDGLYYADSQRLAQVLHQDARYINTVDGNYINHSRNAYFAVVDQRQSPASNKEIRSDEILAVEFGGPNLAFAKVRLVMMGRLYTDFLTLFFGEGQWWIISKVFAYKQAPEESQNAIC